VIAKWFVEEEDTEKALEIKDLHVKGGVALLSPVLALFELGNVLARHPSITAIDSERAFGFLLDLGLELRSFAEPTLLRESFETSRRLRISFYDACYVALARRQRCPFVTADKELHRRVKRHCDSHLLRKGLS